MRIAIIDLGTNSVRFDVHQLGPAGYIRLLHRDKIMVRLGQGVFTSGELDQDAIHRTTHAFNLFKKVAAELKVTRMVALGTSALREAADSNLFVDRLRKQTGIDVRVISGPEEARLIALGILSNEKGVKGKVGLIDIGGGSTEITIANGKKIVSSDSFPLGTARLQQVFLKKSPPSPESVDQLRLYIRKTVSAKLVDQHWPRPAELIGSSGTIRALTKITRKSSGKKVLKLKDLSALVKKMQKMTTTQLLGVQGMESKRVDMILAGAVLLEECMLALRVDKLKASEFSLRDGILKEQVMLSKKHHRSQIALHLTDLYEKAGRFGLHHKRLESVNAMSESLFAGLRSLHRLDRDYRLYLGAASILRNTGESVSLIGHQEHSYYIVKNAKFAFIDEWESELVAQLCLHHEEHKMPSKNLPFAKEPARRQLFSKLLAMLSIVDALDIETAAPAAIKRVSVSKNAVRLVFAGGTATDLEAFRVEQRAALFRTAFKRSIQVSRA